MTDQLLRLDEYVLTVAGDPVPWATARKLGSAPNAPRRMPGRQEAHAGLIRAEWERQHGGKKLWLEKGRPIRMVGHFYICRPKSTHYGSGRNERQLNSTGLGTPHPTGKPDLSNLLKMVEDALTKTLWQDDDQVVQLGGWKRYVDWWMPSRSVLRITPL